MNKKTEINSWWAHNRQLYRCRYNTNLCKQVHIYKMILVDLRQGYEYSVLRIQQEVL